MSDPNSLIKIPPFYPLLKTEILKHRSKSIDEILDTLTLGYINFRAPTKMRLNDHETIRLILGENRPLEYLAILISLREKTITDSIKTSNRMEAKLHSSGFRIDSITSERQALSLDKSTSWMWEIEALKGGQQQLHLVINILLNIEGESTPRTMRTYKRTIDVEIPLLQKVTIFIKGNWQWLWATILIPFFSLILRRRKNPKREKYRD